jgi:hypothetical protein
MEGRGEQLVEHPGVEPVLVGGDLRGPDPSAIERPLEEPRADSALRRRERNTSTTWPNWSMAWNRQRQVPPTFR